MNIKRLNPYAKIPLRATPDSAGYDLYAAIENPVVIPAHETVKIDTGWAMEIPEGYFGAIFARSGLSTKKGLRPSNCCGVVDADYRGPVIVALHNDFDWLQTIEPGERIAQLIILPFQSVDEFVEVPELTNTIRGASGFGSTGKK